MKLLLSFVLLAFVAVGAQAQENRIAAVVNSDIITVQDLSTRITLLMASSEIPDTPGNRQRLEPRVLRQMIDEKLEMQEAKRLNVTVTPKEVDDAIDSIEKRNNMPKGGIDAFLKHAGVPKSALIGQVRASIAWSKVVRNQLSQDVSVSDEEINEAMSQIRADVGKSQSHVAEIYLAVDNPSQDADVRRLADQLIQQIRAGANFSAVAQQFSQSPSSAVGGDIGWVTPSELPPLLGEALTKMSPGQMSYPLKTPSGYYILYMMGRRIMGQASPDNARLAMTEVFQPLASTASAAHRQRVMAAMQHLSDTAKNCNELAKMGQVPPFVTHSGEISLGQLPSEIRSIAQRLKVGQASEPLQLNNTPGIGVFMVCSRQEVGVGMPTREQVTQSLERARLDALARRYLLDLRRSAYVNIRA